jgi:hypothetical protein
METAQYKNIKEYKIYIFPRLHRGMCFFRYSLLKENCFLIKSVVYERRKCKINRLSQ